MEGGKKSTASFEEEMVRTRTRFSVFEIWYQNLVEAKAIGRFSGWGKGILSNVEPGDTVEFRAQLEIVPLQALFRLFLWFVEQAKMQGTIFSVKGEELKKIKESERNVRALLGSSGEEELLVIAKPEGGEGPSVALQLASHWMIGRIGHLSGYYSIVAQVDEVLGDGEELPALRITHDAPPTPAELTTLREVVQTFIEPAKELGVTVSSDDASIKGPALWATPIAIYR